MDAALRKHSWRDELDCKGLLIQVMMPRILPLPADAISQIHSSKNITSLQDVVLALLENSLDASATKIEVTVDFRRGGCTVEDDGEGIPAAEFEEGGGLGKMYHTSKRLPHVDMKHDLHGSTGTYLASLASLSLLSITSRQSGHPEQSTITMHQARVISRQVGTTSSGFDGSGAHGTQVTVRDLFGNMPVRVRQRTLAAEDGGDDDKAWYHLKHGIAALLLAWPMPCAVRLSDSNRSDRKVYLTSSHPSSDAPLTRSGIRQLETGRQSAFGVKDALPIAFQAGLAPPESRPEWVPVSASAVDLTVKGLICLDPAPTKQCQFVSLGIQPCARSSGFNDMYDAINKVFANSSFGAAEEGSDVDEQEKDRRKRDRRYKADGFTRKQMHGRKGVDRWPMFILQVRFRNQQPLHANAGNLSDASLKSIAGVLEATVTQWLAAHHFRPRKRSRRKKNDAQERPASAISTRTASTSSAHTGSLIGATATPDTKRTNTADSDTTSKKRKIVDLSGRPRSMDRSLVTPTDGAESPFRLWSRIKIGKQSRRLDEPVLRKTATAPEGQTGSFTEPNPNPNTTRSVFTLPSVEAGSLNAARQLQTSIHRTAGTPGEVASPSNTLAGSSDDFGSVDDDELVTVAVETEARLGPPNAGSEEDEATPDEIVDWIDPRSKQRYRVNTRTGVVLPARPKATNALSETKHRESSLQRQSAAINTTVSSTGRSFSMARRATPSRPMTRGDDEVDVQWLPGFLQQWNNPVFVHQNEERIPVALPDGPSLDNEDTVNHRCNHNLLQQGVDKVGSKGVGRLTKGSLRSVKVIRQVDRKFILCKTRDGEKDDGQSLVLVDQHAASERVMLEGLLAELCEPAEKPAESQFASPVKTSLLEKPLRFQIALKEHELFLDHTDYFSSWGILYRLSQREEIISAAQDVRNERQKEHILTVTHLPPAIAERCTLIPRILIEMLRSEVWTAAETNRRPALRVTNTAADDSAAEDQHAWLKRIGSCPKGIIDMLNSRACRSAIMFNDELSIQQCEELVSGLSACAFPFMCAHGRVSMVPLVGLGADGSDGAMGIAGLSGRGGFSKQQESEKGFSAAFGQWIGRNESRDS